MRVLANASSLVEFLPEALSAFLQANERIHVDVEERVSAEIVRGVDEGVADIGICRDFVATGGLDVIPYRSDHLALVVPRDHPLAHRTGIGFEETLAYDHLGLASNASLNALMQRIAAEKGHELNYRSFVSSFDAACRFIEAGLAVSILPLEAVARRGGSLSASGDGGEGGQRGEAARSRIVAVPLHDAWAERRFVICVRERAALTLAAARLVDHLLATR